jgi:hypothetical protein
MDKKWYHSKTIWGGLIAVGASVTGVSVSANELADLTNNIEAVISLFGGLLAIYGRMRVGK